MRIFVLALACLALAGLPLAGPAAARDLVVTVTDAAGHPAVDAVVTLHGPVPPPLKSSGAFQVSQKGIAFHPFVLVVPAGATVAFPNQDKVRHHVYSFSPAKRFELKLYSGDESRSVLFDKPGIVALGCNIHDKMVAFIDVVDTPWAAKTDEQGRAVIPDAPTGAVMLSVWHPFMKARNNQVDRQVVLAPGVPAAETVQVELQPAPAHQHH
jgi:plastocyanin